MREAPLNRRCRALPGPPKTENILRQSAVSPPAMKMLHSFFQTRRAPLLGGAVVLLLLSAGCQTPGRNAAEPPGAPLESVTMAERRLLDIHTRQERLMESYRRNPGQMETASMEMQVIQLIRSYEAHLAANPDDTTARILYGKFLNQVGQTESAIRQFLEVDRRQPDIPVVKQQIGNYLAEEGRYMAALPYFINASDLAPDVGIYPFQLGHLLYRYAEEFIRDGFFDRSTLETEMQTAFREAIHREPENYLFHLRYGESFYDLQAPDWNAAFAHWEKTAPLATSPLDRQTIRLHQARVLVELEKVPEAEMLAASISHPDLIPSRDLLLTAIRTRP